MKLLFGWKKDCNFFLLFVVYDGLEKRSKFGYSRVR